MKHFTTHTIPTLPNKMVLENYLRQHLQISGRRLQKLTRARGLLLNGKQAFLKQPIQSGDRLQILDPNPTESALLSQAGQLDILLETEELIIINKPAGLLSHPTSHTTSGTVANFLAGYSHKQQHPFPIHLINRLDRDTSGCLLAAKHPAVQAQLTPLLHTPALQRRYWAIVIGQVIPSRGCWEEPLGPHSRLPNRRMVRTDGQSALTHYQVLSQSTSHTLLELELSTGRTHQIRVHAAWHGHPLLGDRMYGTASPFLSRQALHACFLTLDLPPAPTYTIYAPVPADFQQALHACHLILPTTPAHTHTVPQKKS